MWNVKYHRLNPAHLLMKFWLTWNCGPGDGFVALCPWGWALQSCHLLFNCSAFVLSIARIQQWWKLLVEDALITASQDSGELYILMQNSSFTSTPDNIRQHCAFSFSQLNYNLVLLQHTFQTYFPQVLAAVKLSLIHSFHFHFLHPNLLLQNIGIGQPEEQVKFVSKMHFHSLEISEGPRNSLHCQMKILQFVLLRPLQFLAPDD